MGLSMLFVRYQNCFRFKDRVDDPQVVGLDRRACFRHFNDCIGKQRRFYFCCAPGKLYGCVYTFLFKVSFCKANELGGNLFPLQVFYSFDFRIQRVPPQPT